MGRRIRVATICQAGRFYKSTEENRKYVLRLLDLTLLHEPDIVCLPEAFTTVSVTGKSIEEIAESIPGPTTKVVAERAKEHSCYIICPILTKRDLVVYNSAIVIDRSGDVLGIYDKVHPVTSSSDYTLFERGVTPGSEVPVFDLDFGRIGIQICFDICFPEGWEELARKGAKLVFWSSAYNGGFPLQVYACLHHYYVVSSVRSDKSRIIDPLGMILDETDRLKNVIYRDINLDFVVAHYDFNHSIPDLIMKKYPGRVEIRSRVDDAHFLVEPIDETITTEQLMREFGFEPASKYFQRHKEAYKFLLEGKRPPPQKAAHGDRPQYAKWV